MPNKLSLEEFINRANLKHNHKYSYEKSVYIGIEDKLTIICPKHGEFQQVPHTHLRGNGCKKCSHNMLVKSEFIAKANIVHNGIYEYKDAVYNSITDKIKIECKKHGNFTQKAQHHLSGQGCPKCGKIKMAETQAIPKIGQSLLELNRTISEEWDYNKNIKSPKEYYAGSLQKAHWKCKKCNNEWECTISNRTRLGSGCPKCRQSKGELEIEKCLKTYNVSYKREYKLSGCLDKKELRFDFAVFDENDNLILLLEYNGKQHYELTTGFYGDEEDFNNRKKRDSIKVDFCNTNNINLLIIPYTNFNQIQEIIKQELYKL